MFGAGESVELVSGSAPEGAASQQPAAPAAAAAPAEEQEPPPPEAFGAFGCSINI